MLGVGLRPSSNYDGMETGDWAWPGLGVGLRLG